MRLLGGLLYLGGMLIMAWNVVMTVRARQGGRCAGAAGAAGARLTEQHKDDTPWRTHAPTGHEKIETSNFLMIVLILLAVAVGGMVEIVPLFFQQSHHAAGRRASSPTPRCSWPAATSTSARAATTATRR